MHPMFITAPFTIVMTWKQPKCPLTAKWIKKTCVCVCVCINTAAAKSLQSCPTLFDPIDSSPPGSPVPGMLQARILE